MKKVIEPCLQFLQKKSGIIVALIKPQFEASRHEIKKGGLITNKTIHNRTCDEFKKWFIDERLC